MPNKLSQFWQELKRRKVTRVITVYAAAAFVIIELVDIVAPNLGLPTWTFNLVLILLLIGFVITIIVSWIYDIHPEGGIVKTEPAHKVKPEDILKSSSGWKIASYISFVVIVGLIILNVIPRAGKREILDKSIAVLPFRNDSPEQERMYFINGTMESILNNLSKIEDLRVVSRNSVEQYRDNPKPTPMVAEEMNVSYILEGSGHRDGDNVRLFVQLLDGRKDQHLWSKSYDANIEEIFAMQSDIAQLVAAEINAIITPEEQMLISKVPTNDLTAYDLFQRGMEDYWKYQINNDNISDLVKAKEFYHRALAHDSTFALAYTGLAWIYWEVEREGYNLYQESYFSENFLDSILILADRALSCDPQLSDAYTLRGLYYWETGESEKAATEFEKAIDLNPNDWMAYRMKGDLYFLNDPLVSIQSYHNALLLYRGSEIPKILGDLSDAYASAGFVDKAKRIDRERLELDGDSVKYLSGLSLITKFEGKFTEANGYIRNAYRLDTNNITSLSRLSWSYLDLHEYRTSLEYFEKYIQRMKSLGTVDLNSMNRIGYAYWNNGLMEEADYYFGKQIEYCKRSIELGRVYSQTKLAYYDLAGVYAFLGDREKAYEYLRILNQDQIMNFYIVSLLRIDPLLDNIRDEPEFQQIVRDVEAKYQAEHERVRQWLEENGML